MTGHYRKRQRIRLTIITNDAERAVPAFLSTAHCPPWCRVVSDDREIYALPKNARVIGIWFGKGARSSSQYQAMELMKNTRGLTHMTDDDWLKLNRWIIEQRASREKAA